MVDLYSDEEIMIKVKNNQLALMKPLFDRYHVKLYNFFLRLTYNEDVSKDLVQNVFYRIIKYRKTYNPEYKFKSWIYQLARNNFADYVKKNKVLFSDFQDVASIHVETNTALESLEQKEKKQALYEAMAQLPEDTREILVMSRFEGLKYEEIGHILNCSVGAVKVKVHRAINQLKEVYFKNN